MPQNREERISDLNKIDSLVLDSIDEESKQQLISNLELLETPEKT